MFTFHRKKNYFYIDIIKRKNILNTVNLINLIKTKDRFMRKEREEIKGDMGIN